MRRGPRRALVAGAVTVGALTTSFVPFIWPRTGAPAHADAVIVLSGDHGERLAGAMELIERGVSNTLVFDGALDSARALELCRGNQPFEVICLLPEPDNTQAEARAAAHLAEAKGWTRVVVSTSTFHVTRSSLLFRRCLRAAVDMVAGDNPPFGGVRLAQVIIREWLAVGYLLTLDRDC